VGLASAEIAVGRDFAGAEVGGVWAKAGDSAAITASNGIATSRVSVIVSGPP
jgi:hypothetical protein